MSKTYIGIDNGASGSIGVIGYNGTTFGAIPAKREQSYTKKKQEITRICAAGLRRILVEYSICPVFAIIERPFINPQMFRASVSAARALESVLVVLEEMNIPYQYIDSKEWQKSLLPSGIKGTTELKKASSDIGIRMFPDWADAIRRHGDADGILIAEYARRAGL